ncbi:MAG: hypothetical protein IPP32_07400 [Bacteroidetes bacterium]|nr:hypothetical protein [Bacteroidota bacterium]
MQNSGQLSPSQLSLLKNTEFIHQKTAALQQINYLFQNFQQVLAPVVLDQQTHALKDIPFASPKISKGENYLGLPYLVLDYPAHFATPSIFSFRTFFWWGNFFSFTLHLQGPILDKYRAALINNKNRIHESNFYICIANNPWMYNYETYNYKRISDLTQIELIQILEEKPFIKFSIPIEIEHYPSLISQGYNYFSIFIGFLS